MAANLIPTITSPPPIIQQQQQHNYATINSSSWWHTPSPLLKAKARIGPLYSSPSPSPLVKEEDGVSSKAATSIEDADKLTFRECKACGREEIERGCNGEGRIQGGIATIPGFGWWPIKAYRPCPGFVECGGRYRRRGQSMDEVAWGRTEKDPSIVSLNLDEIKSSKKSMKPEKSK